MRNLSYLILIFFIGLLLNGLRYENIVAFATGAVFLLIFLGWTYRDLLAHPFGCWKYRQKAWNAAIEQFSRSIRLYPRDAFAHFMRANCYVCLGQYELGLADYTKVLTLQPKWIQCRLYIGILQYKRANFRGAIEQAEACLSSYPKWAEAFALRGDAYFRLGQEDAARADYEMILRVRPLSGYAQLGLAKLCLKQGDFDEAIALSTDVINMKIVRIDALSRRAYAYALKGDLTASLRDCNQAIAEDPDASYPYGTRGHTYFLMERYSEALADFQKQESLKPNHWFAYAGQAVTYLAQGETERARATWQQLISLKPKYRDAQQLDRDYYPSRQMVEAANRIVASLDEGQSNLAASHDAEPGY